MDRNDNENIIYIFENLVWICLMLFFLRVGFFLFLKMYFRIMCLKSWGKWKYFIFWIFGWRVKFIGRMGRVYVI